MQTATPRPHPVVHNGRTVPGLKLVSLKGYRGLGRLGLSNTQGGAAQGMQVGAAVGGASAAAIGAATGSVVGPIGTAVGALVGVVVGALSAPNNTASHIGSWDSSLAQAIASLPSTVAGVGRQIPWNANSHGLTQMMEALLATGMYMAWDTSLVTSYDVCAHWAMTFAQLAQTCATAVCTNPAGASVTVQITSQPGGPVGPAPYTFTNPGISVGPEAVASKVIMPCMTWLFNRWQIAGSPQLSQTYARQMGSNSYAQKVFALMVDYVAANNAPPAAVTPPAPVPNVAPIVQASSGTVATAISQVGTTAAPIPVSQPVTIAIPQPAAQPMAQAQPIASAPQTVAQPAPNISITTGTAPAAAAPAASSGLLSNPLLLLAIGGGIYLLARKG